VVECLLCKLRALGSNTSLTYTQTTTKTTTKKRTVSFITIVKLQNQEINIDVMLVSNV
jgi:hypothetical protein